MTVLGHSAPSAVIRSKWRSCHEARGKGICTAVNGGPLHIGVARSKLNVLHGDRLTVELLAQVQSRSSRRDQGCGCDSEYRSNHTDLDDVACAKGLPQYFR